MSLSLKALIQFVIIFTFVCIFGWNLLSMKEGLEGEGEGEEKEDEDFDEENEIIDSKTGKKRKLTKREKRAIKRKQDEEQRKNNEDIDERVKSFNKE